jgi:hypothetical protein
MDKVFLASERTPSQLPIYWVPELEDFNELIKTQRVSYNKYSIYAPWNGGVLVYGSLQPTKYPLLKRLSDGRKARNCHTMNMTPILDCPPDKTFYLGYVGEFKKVRRYEEFYLFEGEDSSYSDRPVEISTTFSDLVHKSKIIEIDDIKQEEDSFTHLDHYDEELFAKLRERFANTESKNTISGLEMGKKSTDYLVYYIHLNQAGYSVPPWSEDIVETVRILYVLEDGKWSLSKDFRPFIIHEWQTGETENLRS